MKPQSFVYRFLVCVFFLCGTSAVQAECNIHDHQCQFHSIGNQFFHVGNNSHHTKGMQLNPNIPDTLEEGLFAVGVWQDNASGQSADLDVDVLLPSFTQDLDGAVRPAGAFIVTDNAAQGGAESSSDPFIGYAEEHDRHVSTFQHQVTFNNAFATAQHSKDANGLAPIPASTADKACTDTNNFSADSCEAVHIKGDVPTGVYSVAVTNFDVHNLSDPSTPHYDMWVYATPTTQGTLVSTGPEEHLSGSLANKGETSGVHSVFFRRWEQKPHAEMGVVYDIYAGTLPGKTSYSNPYKKRYGDMIYTFQDKTVQYVTTQYSDTITGDGINRGTKNLGVIGAQNVTTTNTVAVHKVIPRPVVKPKPQPVQTSSIATGCGVNMSCPEQSFPWDNNQEKTAQENPTLEAHYENKKLQFREDVAEAELPFILKGLSWITGEEIIRDVTIGLYDSITDGAEVISQDRMNDGETFEESLSGDLSFGESIYAGTYTLDAVGATVSIGDDVSSSFISAVTPDPIEGYITEKIKTVSENEKVQYVFNEIEAFKEYNPKTARAIDVVTTVVEMIPYVKNPKVSSDSINNSSDSLSSNSTDLVNLASEERTIHILDGDNTGGGHRYGTGFPGKSEFPEGWSDDEIMNVVSDIATDPSLSELKQGNGNILIQGSHNGVNINVVLNSDKTDIITAFPINTPRNPR